MRHQPRERAFHGDGLTADIKTAIDDDGEQRNHRHHAHKAQFFAHHRHQEVGVRFRQVMQLFNAGAQAHAEPFTTAQGNQRV
ncbi:hypothetical protein G6F31_020278 [Rhizopus arrhizus]|nr:hypothetical protein G6F31_020278 [Rhizopus arrhizus]